MKTTKGIIILLSIVFTMSMPNCGMAKKNVSPITIGCIVSGEGNVDATFKNLQEMGFTSCQIGFPGDRSQATIDKLIAARRKYGIKITTVITIPGRCVWDFREGPSTIGLAPVEGREEKLEWQNALPLWIHTRGSQYGAIQVVYPCHEGFGDLCKGARCGHLFRDRSGNADNIIAHD